MNTERKNRKRAIREKCISCCCGNKAEVRRCPATDCPLWVFRMGVEVNGKDRSAAEAEE
jgi:hypothetical protein